MSESSGVVAQLKQLIEEEMDVESIVLDGEERETLRAFGRLRYPAHEVFARLRPRFEENGHTPFLRRKDGQDTVVAVNQLYKADASPVWPNVILFVLTIISVLSVGVLHEVGTQSLNMDTFRASLPTAIAFAASILGILGAHEMGHYVMAQRHGVRVTLPYFIPLPLFLGTMGAVIAMKEPAPNRRVQFDIGVAGPLAGMVIALPVLIVGLFLSDVLTVPQVLALLPPDDPRILQEGNSLLYLGIKYAIFGKILPAPNGEDVFIHAVALAGWAGLLITALNLLPVGQLDGGHVLYGLFGDRAQLARWPIIVALLLLGVLYQGWWLWAGLILLLARRHAPVLDEITDLDTTRKWVAVGVLILFVLIFMPVPLREVLLR